MSCTATNAIVCRHITAHDYLRRQVANGERQNQLNRQNTNRVFGQSSAETLAITSNADPDNIDMFIDAARENLNKIIVLGEVDFPKQMRAAERIVVTVQKRYAAEIRAAGGADNPFLQRLLNDVVDAKIADCKRSTEQWQSKQATFEADLEDILDEVRRLAENSNREEFAERLHDFVENSIVLLANTLDRMHDSFETSFRNLVKRWFSITRILDEYIAGGNF